jgi:RND family efflux transporter MFP subunit
MKKYLIALVMVIMGISLLSCNSADSASKTTSTNQISTVKKGTITNQITSTGNLKMPHYAKLSFGASGTVAEVDVILGDSVKEGQILAKLDASTQSTLQQALLQAQVNQKQAQMSLENARTPTLSSSGTTVSAPDPLDVESKEIALERAKLAVEDAQRQLDGAVIIAPFDGLVAEVNITPEDKVSSGTVAIRIIDPDQLQVDTLVNETDIFNVSLGMPATIEVTALSQVILPATVIAISPSATVSGGVVNYTVELQARSPTYKLDVPVNISGNQTGRTQFQGSSFNGTFPGGSSNNQTRHMQFPGTSTGGTLPSSRTTNNTPSIPTLKEGLSVNVTIVISESSGVLLVPVRAISREGGTAYVTVMNDDGTTQKTKVVTGMNDWQNIEIKEGLSEGEQIVISPSASSTTTTNSSSSSNSRQGPPGGMMMIR